MRHPLEARIASLRGRVRRLLALHGLSWVVAGALLGLLLAGLTDWAVHLAAEVRVALLVALGALAAWLAARHVVRPLVVRFRDLDIALKIERRWPGLNDRLASTIQFLRTEGPGDRDDILGSKALREATVRQTLQEVETIDFRQVVDLRPARRAVMAAAGALALGITVVALAPQSSRIAMARLFRPYGATQWPRQTHLVVTRAATKVARGEPFLLEVTVREGDRVPGSAQVTYRFDDGEAATERLRPDNRGRFHGRIEAVSRPFRFTVAAGDDRTAPRAVRVVPPPALQKVALRIVPPAYTGLLPAALDADGSQVEAVVGTRLEIEATANKPLAKATLRRGDTDAGLAAALGPDSRTLTTGFDIAESGPFWFELLDTEGFRSRDETTTRFEVRATEDEAPRVTIDEPPGDLNVTPDADVPLRIAAQDDFGLNTVRLRYKVATGTTEPSKEQLRVLWTAEGAPGEHRRTVEYTWHLADPDFGPALEPGSVVTFHADALDFDDLKGPNLGKSRELRLRIVTKEDALRELENQRREIREELGRLLAMQRQAITPVEESRRTLDAAGKLPEEARNDLRIAATVQRQVGARIGGATEGLRQKVDRFLAESRNNKVDNPDALRQMEAMQQAVERLARDHAGPAEEGLSRAGKALDESNPPDGESSPQPAADPAATEAAREGLAQAETSQKAIAAELKRMLDELGEFETFRGIVQEAKGLLKEHEEAMKGAAEAASNPEMAGKSAEDLPPEAKSALENLAGRQSKVREGLGELLNKMDEMAGRLESEDSSAAGAMQDAASQSRRVGTLGKLADAADRLRENQMNSARDGQEAARQELKELVDTLENRREHELAKILKGLKQAGEDLKKLRYDQAKNLDRTRQAQANPNEMERKEQLQQLAKEEQKLQDELKSQLQKLRKLGADAAAQSGSRASGKMGQAQQDLDQGDGDQGGKDQEDALADLQDTQQQIEDQIKQTEAELALEQLAKVEDALRGLKERQDKVVEDTEGYEAKRSAPDGFGLAERAGVRALGRVEGLIQQETEGLVQRLENAPVFSLTLKRAAESMQLAAEGLGNIQTDAETQDAERAAARRLAQLLEALRPDDGEGAGGGGGGGGGGGKPKLPGDGIALAAQLKMLKLLQQDLNLRTEELDDLRRRDRELSPEQEAELARLHDDQRRIADMARDLTQPKHPDGEED